MATATIRDFQELPAILTLKDIQDVLGICKSKVYELAHTEGFPIVLFVLLIRLPRDRFLAWLDAQAGVQERNDDQI